MPGKSNVTPVADIKPKFENDDIKPISVIWYKASISVDEKPVEGSAPVIKEEIKLEVKLNYFHRHHNNFQLKSIDNFHHYFTAGQMEMNAHR